jgi:hypothetical protein
MLAFECVPSPYLYHLAITFQKTPLNQLKLEKNGEGLLKCLGKNLKKLPFEHFVAS